MIARRLQRFFGRRMPLPLLTRTLQGVLGAFEVLAISAVMQIGLVLPMAYYFHRATVVGLPANMLVVPLTEIMMPAAVVAVTLGYASMPLAKIPAMVAGFSLHAIVGTLKWLGGMRAADLRVPVPGTFAIVLASVALVLAMFLSRRKTRWMIAGLSGLVAAAIWICAIPPSPLVRPGVLELTAIDVGQGDSLLLVSPQGRTMLVDAGGLPHWMHSEFDIGEAVVSPYLWSRGINRLDAVALTHAHADHMGGMAAVLTNFRPREFWIGTGPRDPELQKLLHLAERLGIQVMVRKEGDIFALGGAAIQVFAPDSDNEATSAKHANEDSLVMKVSFGRTSTLLEGDAEKKTERRIAEEISQADLLKVAHHGSATSTLPELLEAVRPRWAVISVGPRNVYKHPREEVLERLGQAGVRTYRTDLDGATTFYLDGDNVSPGVPGSR